MNDFHLLATVAEYPRTLSKDPLAIRIKAINVRDAWIPGARSQHISCEIPLIATGNVARALLNVCKHTRYVLFSGFIDIASSGRINLVVSKYTHLPGRVQQAKSYVDELQERGEILREIEIPVLDLLDGPGEISRKDPDSDKGQSWQTT